MKTNQIGIVHRINLVKTFPNMKVTFNLVTTKEVIHCVVSNNELAQQFLFLDNGTTEIAFFGFVNHHNQLDIQKMTIRNPTSYILTFAMKV